MMEPHATVAAWEGDKLTLWTSNQMIAWGKGSIAKILSLKPENVRLDSPYVGGGFGGKLFVRADAVLAALGAKAAGRPVKVALTRPSSPTTPPTGPPRSSGCASARPPTGGSPPSPTRASREMSPRAVPRRRSTRPSSSMPGPTG